MPHASDELADEAEQGSYGFGYTSGRSNGATPAVNRTLLFLTIGLLFDLIAFTLILPLFPSLFDFYAATSAENDLYRRLSGAIGSVKRYFGLSDDATFNNVLLAGGLGSMFSFLQFFSSPLIGALSDKYGRKPLLLATLFGSLASYYLWSIANRFEVFVLSRVVGGLSKASVSICIAIVADMLPQTSRGKGMALIGVTFSIGFIVGPMIGAFFATQARAKHLSEFFRLPAQVSLGLTIVEILWIAVCVPETFQSQKRTAAVEQFKDFTAYLNPLSLFQFSPLLRGYPLQKICPMRKIGFAYFAYLFVYSGLEFTITFITHGRFAFDNMQQGQMFVICGFLMIVVQGGYVRKIQADKQKTSAIYAMMMVIPGFMLIGLSQTRTVFYLGLGLYSIASAVIVPCLTTELCSYVSDEDKGTALGTFRALGALARALGPIFISVVFCLIGPQVCYVLASLLFLQPLMTLKRL